MVKFLYDWISACGQGFLAFLCIWFGIKFICHFRKHIHPPMFRLYCCFSIFISMLNAVAVFANYYTIVYVHWEGSALLNLAALPYRILYPISYLTALSTFVYQLHDTFAGTTYAYPRRLFIFLGITVIVGITTHIIAVTLQQGSTKLTEISSFFEIGAIIIMIFFSGFVTFLFTQSLWKVKHIIY